MAPRSLYIFQRNQQGTGGLRGLADVSIKTA